MKVDVLGFQVHQAVFQAVKRGNVEFDTEMIKSIPELAWSRDINGRNIFFIAILNRQEKIFNLLHGLTDAQKMKVISPLDRCRSAERELQWFKEVKNIVPPIFKDLTNSDGKKASEVFSQQHADLVKEGEKWMKEIATSSSVVAALIVTIMFAAAFTIPGGNNDKGAPIFLDDTLFMVFIISDSISLFSGTTSMLMFLGILTSVYAENKANNRPFRPFHLYCSHDDSLLCRPCCFAKGKLNQSGYDPDYFTCLCSGDPIRIIAISPSC
ncbi:hypothetical protein VitviT2T_019654 [Vitis vinifera]|uniref:PGG domain-containing protein n=1 Tax=Vitis vinifera TaxID=29760 RepID=A0ABY9D1Q3_VITVI|nr:hypothetical protein VitviT2T_019654 [Vitis vinifera]